MPGVPPTARCYAQFAVPLEASTDRWRTSLDIATTDTFTAASVLPGDVVFLDLNFSEAAPGTVGRYIVEESTPSTAENTVATLRWAGLGDPVSPGDAAGYPGYVSRASAKNRLVWHPKPSDVGVPQYVMEGARNVESQVVLDNLAPSDGVRQVRNMAADTGFLFSSGDVVALNSAGKLVRAVPADPTKMPAVGVVVKAAATPGDYEVQFGGALELQSTFIPGKFVWVGSAGLTQDMSDVPADGVLQQVGVALSTGIISLAVPGLVVTK